MNPNDIPKAEAHLRGLEVLAFDVSGLWRDLANRISAHETRQPTSSDLSWPLLPTCSLEEHLQGEERPTLSCAIAKGRAYALSTSQRAVLREWYNMIPTPVVQVLELATFPASQSPVMLIREVILRTEEHVDPKNRRLMNGPRKITIDRWGDFMSACKTYELDTEMKRETSRFSARVAKLFDRADERDIDYRVTKGTIAVEWQAECEQQGLLAQITDEAMRKVVQQRTRDVLRDILLHRGEDALAALVKEPSFLGDKSDVAAEFADVSAELDALLNSQLK